MANLRDSEINPDHPVTKGYHDQWHKLALILLDRLNTLTGTDEQVITPLDVDLFAQKFPNHAILAHDRKDGLHLRAVTMAEARRLGAQ